MPRPKKPGAPEPKRRSRKGCWPCKGRKVKCGEEHPTCANCQRTGEVCDYSVRLNWEGRRTKRSSSFGIAASTDHPCQPGTQPQQSSYTHTFSVNGAATSIQPKPIPRRLHTAPGGLDSEKGQQEPANAHAQCPSALEVNSAYATPPQDAPALFSSPIIPRHVVDSFSSTTTIRRSLSSSRSSSVRPHKRSKSLAEHGDSEAYIHPRLFPSPSSFVGSSPPTSHVRSGSVLMSREAPLTPLTPLSSGMNAEDEPPMPLPALASPASPDSNRLSVNYLMSGSPSVSHHPKAGMKEGFGPLLSDQAAGQESLEETIFYGYDFGNPDADINRNDDSNVDSSRGAIATDRSTFMGGHYSDAPSVDSLLARSRGFYDQPLPIRIPRSLHPLPSKLRDDSMNLLYFHHFLNHTAKVLVPYDDPKSNPFRTILPQMATGNDHLLSLLLAYSASHRARLLRQREPQMRIALWVQDIFPALRRALGDKEQTISNTNLATAIMLASLEIISPTAFGYNIPWQAHLNLARDLMRKRLAYLRENACNLEEDKICSFLWSWFAYLDVLGSLSGGVPGTNSPGSWVLEYTLFSNADSQHEIDCIMGFTTRCVQLLAQVADLARHCDLQRIRPDTLLPQPNWTPTQNSVQLARQLEGELMESMARPSRPCRHVRNVETRDRQEMVLMNEAFHWAGLVHIHRRVYGKRSGHADVQVPVQRILACMGCIRAGGTAETGFLFPMFVAGCNTQVERQRMGILERLGRVESNGMTQVRKARLLMQKVWETGQPWEPLLSSEFIG